MNKRTVLLILLSLSSAFGYSQKIIKNSLWIDVDDINQIDTVMSKNKLTTLEIYDCSYDTDKKDSCKLIWKKRYDSVGMLIEQEKGDNLNLKQIDFIIEYKKISDTVVESITRYPPSSLKIPSNFFSDSIINGKRIKTCVYKSDVKGNIFVRSRYNFKNKNNIDVIRRFDIDGHLKEVYLPNSDETAKQEWNDTIATENTRIYSRNMIFDGYFVKITKVYGLNLNLLETIERNTTYTSRNSSLNKIIFVYDDSDRLVEKNTLGEDNRLISEEKYIYKNSLLIRYTEDEDISDGYFNIEKDFDENGNLIFYQEHSLGSSRIRTWKYIIATSQLPIKREFYMNNVFKSSLLYVYH